MIKSSDSTVDVPEYDSHGNTITLGTEDQLTEFSYDSSDRNTGIKETLAPHTGSNTTNEEIVNEISYVRDVTNRIIERTSKTDDVIKEDVEYFFSGSGDNPDALLDDEGNITQKYIQLPGDIVLTIKPSDSTPAGKTYSIPNIHGDVSATLDANGTLISQHMTGPFGETITGNTNPNNTVSDASWSYVGQHEKLTETSVSLSPIQMGARIYIPTLGRFLSVDPIQGGTENNYVYPQNPITRFDLTGKCPDACVVEGAAVGYAGIVAGAFIVGVVGWAISSDDNYKITVPDFKMPKISVSFGRSEGSFESVIAQRTQVNLGLGKKMSQFLEAREHRKNPRKSTKNKHEEANARRQRDQQRKREYEQKSKSQRRKANRRRGGPM